MPNPIPIPDPGKVPVRFRFFNDSDELADAEAWGSGNPPSPTDPPEPFLPVGNLSVPPGMEMETQGQHAPLKNPRNALVSIQRNGMPLGEFPAGGSMVTTDIHLIDVILNVDYAAEMVTVTVILEDVDGIELDNREYVQNHL